MEKKKKVDNKDKKKVLLSIQNASYRYSDADKDEYALKDVSYDFANLSYCTDSAYCDFGNI